MTADYTRPQLKLADTWHLALTCPTSRLLVKCRCLKQQAHDCDRYRSNHVKGGSSDGRRLVLPPPSPPPSLAVPPEGW